MTVAFGGDLRAIAAVLLNESSPVADLQTAARALYDIFSDIGGSGDDASDTALGSGKALSPFAAGACTQDAMRTAMFLRGVRDAIGDVASRSGPVEVVYAGTGPFASLAVPLMMVLEPHEARFTLLDLHAASIDSVQAIVEHFGLSSHVARILQADALAYRHDRAIDVAIVEVMQRALSVEPQLAIVRHLARQMAPHGRIVPQQITVDLVYAPLEYAHGLAAPQSDPFFVAEVADLRSMMLAEPGNEGRLGERIVEIPAVPDRSYAMYATSVQTFGGHVLGAFASGLTQPEVRWDLSRCRAGQHVRFWYQLGERPGIAWEQM